MLRSSQRPIRASRAALGLWLMLVPGLLLVLTATAPTVSANTQHDLAVTRAITPPANTSVNGANFLAVEFEVRNLGPDVSPARSIDVRICAGDLADCQGQSLEAQNSASIGALEVGEVITIRFADLWLPSGAGTFTIDLDMPFNAFDQNAANDQLAYQVAVPSVYRDLICISMTQFPSVLNTGDTRQVSATIDAWTWDGTTTQFGWDLVDGLGAVVQSARTTPAGIPGGAPARTSISLPAFTPQNEGDFTMRAGLFAASSDVNDHNDLCETSISVNDDYDLRIDSMSPARGGASVYPYGPGAIAVEVSNQGNLSVTTDVLLSIHLSSQWPGGSPALIQRCPVTLIPGAAATRCTFDLNFTQSVVLVATFTSSVNSADENQPDNTLTEVGVSARIDALTIGATYDCGPDGICDSGEDILVRSIVPAFAARPLTFRWLLNGAETLSTNESDFIQIPRGDYFIDVCVTDALSDSDCHRFDISAFNRTRVDSPPAVIGEALTRTRASSSVSWDLPALGTRFLGLPDGAPLLELCFDITADPRDGDDAGIDWVQLDLNLSTMLPPTVERTSLVPSWIDADGVHVSPLVGDESWQLISNTTARLFTRSVGCILLTGDLPPADVSISQMQVTPLQGGQVELTWESEGDLSNPYFGGWRIHRRTDGWAEWPVADALLNVYIRDTLVDTVASRDTSWADPVAYPAGTCVGYLIVPVDRQGTPDWARANTSVSALDDTASCTDVDATASGVTVTDLRPSVVYDCPADDYGVWLNWTWPTGGDWTTFNLYRADLRPTTLAFDSPVMMGLQGAPGTDFAMFDNGSLGGAVTQQHTYHYILTPVDAVGNEQLQVLEGNAVSVTVANQYWTAGCREPIPEPEPPEPALGSDYVQGLVDMQDEQAFGAVVLLAAGVIILNLFGGAATLNKIRRARRRLRQRAVDQAGKDLGLDDGIDDDLAGFFE